MLNVPISPSGTRNENTSSFAARISGNEYLTNRIDTATRTAFQPPYLEVADFGDEPNGMSVIENPVPIQNGGGVDVAVSQDTLKSTLAPYTFELVSGGATRTRTNKYWVQAELGNASTTLAIYTEGTDWGLSRRILTVGGGGGSAVTIIGSWAGEPMIPPNLSGSLEEIFLFILDGDPKLAKFTYGTNLTFPNTPPPPGTVLQTFTGSTPNTFPWYDGDKIYFMRHETPNIKIRTYDASGTLLNTVTTSLTSIGQRGFSNPSVNVIWCSDVNRTTWYCLDKSSGATISSGAITTNDVFNSTYLAPGINGTGPTNMPASAYVDSSGNFIYSFFRTTPSTLFFLAKRLQSSGSEAWRNSSTSSFGYLRAAGNDIISSNVAGVQKIQSSSGNVLWTLKGGSLRAFRVLPSGNYLMAGSLIF